MTTRYFKATDWVRGSVKFKEPSNFDIDNDIVLIVGTSGSMEGDIKSFDELEIDADVIAVNKAIALLDRNVKHFVSLDLAKQSVHKDLLEDVVVHSIDEPNTEALDMAHCLWNFENRCLRMSGIYAIIVAVALGYKKILLAGISMDKSGHSDSPNDNTSAYPARWQCNLGLNVVRHCGKYVRSFSGLTKDSFGYPDKEFLES